MNKILLVLVAFSFLALPGVGIGQTTKELCLTGCQQLRSGVARDACIRGCSAIPGTEKTKTVGGVEIKNPLKYDTIEDLIKAIIRFLQALALIVTAIVIVAAGYFFVFSQGDPAKVTQARNMVIYALVGLAIILVAQGIIALIERVIKG